MRHLPTRELEKLAAEQQLRRAPLPVACSWHLADWDTTVELCWNPRHAQRTLRGEGGCGLLWGISTSQSPRTIQIRRAVRATGLPREASALHLVGADTKPQPVVSSDGTAEDSGERVLGYYRTVTGNPRDSLRPTPEDDRTMQEFCATSHGLFLLLQGHGDQARGALYFWDGAALEQTSTMLVSFPTAALPSTATAMAPASLSEAQSTSARLNRRSLVAGILGGLFLAVTGMTAFNLIWHTRSGTPKPPGESPSLTPASHAADTGASLKVEAIGGLLQIRWNPLAPAIQSSENGYVSIVDGKELKTILLSGNDLRTGLMLYSPKNAQLIVSLVGVKAGRSVVESMISVGAPSANSASAPVPARSPAQSQPPPFAAPAEVRKPGPLPLAATSAALNPPQFAVPARTFAPASQPATPVRSVSEPSPQTSTAIARVQPTTSVQGESSRPTQAPPAIPPPSTSVPGELSRPTQAPPAIQQPSPPPQTSPNFTPARPRNRVAMAPADDLRRLLLRPVRIPVTVQVDAAGNVTNASADTPNSVAGALASRAVASVKLYSFEPARRGGVPVASEVILVFNIDKK